MKDTFESIYADIVKSFERSFGRKPDESEKKAIRQIAITGTAFIMAAAETRQEASH